MDDKSLKHPHQKSKRERAIEGTRKKVGKTDISSILTDEDIEKSKKTLATGGGQPIPKGHKRTNERRVLQPRNPEDGTFDYNSAAGFERKFKQHSERNGSESSLRRFPSYAQKFTQSFCKMVGTDVIFDKRGRLLLTEEQLNMTLKKGQIMSLEGQRYLANLEGKTLRDVFNDITTLRHTEKEERRFEGGEKFLSYGKANTKTFGRGETYKELRSGALTNKAELGRLLESATKTINYKPNPKFFAPSDDKQGATGVEKGKGYSGKLAMTSKLNSAVSKTMKGIEDSPKLKEAYQKKADELSKKEGKTVSIEDVARRFHASKMAKELESKLENDPRMKESFEKEASSKGMDLGKYVKDYILSSHSKDKSKEGFASADKFSSSEQGEITKDVRSNRKFNRTR